MNSQQSNTSETGDFDPNAFLAALKATNAEDLKRRLTARIESSIAEKGADISFLKGIEFEVSDHK